MPTAWDLDDLIDSLESADHRWPPEGCPRECCQSAARSRSGRSKFCWGRTKSKVHSHGQTPQVQGVSSGRMVFLRSYPLATSKEEVKESGAEKRMRVVKCLIGSVVDRVADLSEKAGRAGRSMWKRQSCRAVKRVREVSSSWMKSTSRQLLSCKYRP